ncbi:UxaA family hydrolase [Prosthecobacter dejongeii]|uniref:Altronate hydrolase n=1 Tax=Prosthecobacter dejongeii TaxID=48465 RepID=A0A7W7YL10_9BACT|nr:altronate dehydratase family protein [Prosthecobacter dejongeii]MBB5038024.1 altronate hydrolase [Prosthecobacter dejongeii]
MLLRVHPADDLIVALHDLPAGKTAVLEGQPWTLKEPIQAKHKFAARDFVAGDLATMYGVTVGRATQNISAGALVHTHNLKHEAAAFSGKKQHMAWSAPDVSRWKNRTFQGYKRHHGPAGTANHWLVIPLVFCENRNLAFMREALTRALGYAQSSPYERYAQRLADGYRNGQDLTSLASLELDALASPLPLFPNVSGIKFLEHGLGCGGTRQDAIALCNLLAGYIASPNVAGATILSLGCQHAQVSLLQESLSTLYPHYNKPLHIFEQQKSNSERDMMARAIRTTFEGVALANEQSREPCPLSDLIVGVECGGSDGFSGISANPAIGHTADLLAALGGAPVLSEFPELCGVEQSLCDRCVTPELADRFVHLMRTYEGAAQACGSGFDANPSPGNIRDGLITDAIKSAGAAKKGGTSSVVDVLDYGEPIRKHGGLTLYCTPGNDVESTTALAGAGCNLMLFSTGLGTPTGNPICPTLKISTNSTLMKRMSDILDFDTGAIISGEQSVEQMGESLLELCIATASGTYIPKAVALGQDDFLPWKRGVSL